MEIKLAQLSLYGVRLFDVLQLDIYKLKSKLTLIAISITIKEV